MVMQKTLAGKKLAQALDKPDDDVTPNTRRKPHSLISQIEALEVGECASKALPVSPDITFDEYATNGYAMREALRNSVAASMRAAKARTGGTYEIDTSDMFTTGRKLFIVTIITRTE